MTALILCEECLHVLQVGGGVSAALGKCWRFIEDAGAAK